MKKCDEFYQKVLREYEKTQSVKQTAVNCQTSLVTAQRILITEGVWRSETSSAIGEMWSEGKSVPEIAQKLCVSEKTVQAYLPYSRGKYGGERSKDAVRSMEYRQRMAETAKRTNAEKTVIKEGEPCIRQKVLLTPEEQERLWKTICFDETERAKLSADAKETDWEEKHQEKFYHLHMELILDEDNLSDEEQKELLRLSRAEEGITRELIARGYLSLRNLHYAIQSLFGWRDYHAHWFSLPDDEFNRLTAQRWGGFKDLCGTIFREPHKDHPRAIWWRKYDPIRGYQRWLREQATFEEYNYDTSDNWLDTRMLIHEWEAQHEDLKDTDALENVHLRLGFDAGYNRLIEEGRLRHYFMMGKEPDIRVWKALMLKKEAAFRRQVGIAQMPDTIKLSYLDDADRMTWKASKLDLRAYIGDFSDFSVEAYAEVCRQFRLWNQHIEQLNRIERQGCDEIRRYEAQTGNSFKYTLQKDMKEVSEWETHAIKLFRTVKPGAIPRFQTLYYHYDANWKIRIDVKEVYTVTNWEALRKRWKKRHETDENYIVDSAEKPVEGIVRKILESENDYFMPRCIAADGLRLVEDCGGARGYYELLKTLYGKDGEKSAKAREWAKLRGWTGRRTRPENLI